MTATSRPSWLPTLVLAVILVAALVFLYIRTRGSGEADYFEHLAVLQHLKQVDSQWELDVLKSRIGLNPHYDPLADSLVLLDRLLQQLDEGTARGAYRVDPALAQRQAALRAAIQEKAALIEQFKSHNAVLRNSQAFLPTAADDVRQAVAATSDAHQPPFQRLSASVGQLLLASMLYSQSPSAERRAEVELRLNNLDTALHDPASDTGTKLSILESHVRAVLREQKLVTELLGAITAVPTDARADAINQLLSEEQKSLERRTGQYRQYLLAFSGVLAALLLYAAVRLLRSHAIIGRINEALQNANDNLELRVQQRTGELQQAQNELLSTAREITSTNEALQAEVGERKQLMGQLLQSEKLASIGQLAAGVAHEINNPIGYVFSNFGTLEKYMGGLFEVLAAYEAAEPSHTDPRTVATLRELKARTELHFLKEDIPVLMRESKEGLVRVRKIVRDLKDFSYVDSNPKWQMADLVQGIDSTLNVVNNEIKYKADIVKEYGDLPEVQCLASEINQVVMNLVVNAAHAMGAERGTITIRTGTGDDEVWIEIEDNGSGIAPEYLAHIFDPFFTTKPVGKGTGLGLSLSYGIVQKHHGRIEVETELGTGTSFRVTLPILQPANESAGVAPAT